MRNRVIECTITPADLKALYKQQEGRCAYTGTQLGVPTRFTRVYDPDVLSVDRTDSAIGYVVGNVRLVTKQVNMMKQGMSHEEFVGLCKTIAERN